MECFSAKFLCLLSLAIVGGGTSFERDVGRVCRKCFDVTHPEVCSNSTTCPPNQICSTHKYSYSNKVLFDLGCQTTQICNMAHSRPNIIGRRDSQAVRSLCYDCCSEDGCNGALCVPQFSISSAATTTTTTSTTTTIETTSPTTTTTVKSTTTTTTPVTSTTTTFTTPTTAIFTTPTTATYTTPTTVTYTTPTTAIFTTPTTATYSTPTTATYTTPTTATYTTPTTATYTTPTTASITTPTTAATTTEFQKPCPPGYVGFESSCYIIVYKSVHWDAAQSRCHQLGSAVHLVSINSQAEQDFLAKMLTDARNVKYGVYYITDFPAKQIWIGAYIHPFYRRWTWDDGSAFQYTSWVSGYPINDQRRDKMAMVNPLVNHAFSGWNWKNNSNDLYYAFICEVKND